MREERKDVMVRKMREERRKVESFSGKRDQIKGTNRLNEGKNGELGMGREKNGELGIGREKESNREDKKETGNERR